MRYLLTATAEQEMFATLASENRTSEVIFALLNSSQFLFLN